MGKKIRGLIKLQKAFGQDLGVGVRLRARFCFILFFSFVVFNSYEISEAANGPGPEDTPPMAVPKKRNRYQRSKLTFDESEGEADRRRLLLTTGEDKAIDLDFDANAGANGISYGNPQVVTSTLVKVGEKRQIVFKPLKAGETTVTIRDNDGTLRLIFMVRVTGSNLLRIGNEIRDLLRDVEGLDIRIVGPKVVIEGEVIVPLDYGRLLTVIQDKSYSDFVLNLTTLSPLAMQVMARRIQDDVNAAGAPNVKTRVVNGTIFLEGTVDSMDQANRALKLANFYLPDMRPGSLLERDPTVQRLPPRKLIESFIVVNPPPPRKAEKLVRVTIHFVELSKDYNKIFGFKWQPGFTNNTQIQVGQSQSGAAGASTGGASFGGTLSALLPKLASSQAAGYARVLKTGTLIVRSGQPATLTEATQIPYNQAGQNGQVTSATKDVGLSASVTPLILGQSEDIQLNLEMNQTNLVGRAPSAGATPITATHRVKTTIYVRSSESAAIAGVISSDIGTDFNKDDPSPGSFAQNTDPLFTLLRSKAYRKKKSQFVIFVTPQIIENASEGTEDMKRNFRVKVK
jgi:pilus assembly protein CpaC